ncbi:MAG: hypothetical protein JST51_17260 [Armatimonadetes bacterium]|nr:hypothetical protein [Armatimonadota bacterium]
MSRATKFALPLFLLAALPVWASAQDADLTAKIKAIPRVINVQSSGANYEIMFDQPLDHTNPSGAHFQQRIFLRNAGPDKPVLLGTEGYSARGVYGGELKTILNDPNQLTVEHRFFGKSMPSPVEWKYLTIKNAADDMHDIVTAFKSLYKGKWVASGASKGGQTALFFKAYYPNDVDVTVAYVAPINLAQEDPRIYQWLNSVGDEAIRQKIKDLQIALLKREEEVLPLLNADPKDYAMGVNKAYEYGVLEFPFALWQYGTKPEGLPEPDAPAADLAKAYRQVNSMFYYSDAGIKTFQAFYYQAFTEIGYYNYDITDFRPYLKHNPNPTNLDLCPPGTKDSIVYNPATLSFVYHFLQYEANNVIYVYGETDTWSATQMELIGRTNEVKILVKGAYHYASIRLASPLQKSQVLAAMEDWLGMKLTKV